MTIDPVMLRACAAYLAHAQVYGLSKAGSHEMLRPVARPVLNRKLDSEADIAALWDEPFLITDARCDEFTATHLAAIRKHGGARMVGVMATAAAILDADATPEMMVWWCETLAPKDASG